MESSVTVPSQRCGLESIKALWSRRTRVPIAECWVALERCDVEKEKASLLRQAQASEDRKLRVKREPEVDSVAVNVWIKSERNVYQTDDLYVEEHLHIGPTVPQPRDTLVPKPKCSETKLEPQSPGRETSLEDLPPASAVPPAGLAHAKGSRKRKGPIKTPTVCNSCNRKYSSSSALNVHMRIHTGEQPYNCTMCDAKFNNLSNLKSHMRVHTGEKPYVCTQCNAKFVQSQALKSHMRVHTGEKPHSCITCNAKFAQLKDLKRHSGVHTGEKRYSCSTCNGTFAASQGLKSHMRMHTGEIPFSCKTCNAKFTQLTNFNRHILLHTG